MSSTRWILAVGVAVLAVAGCGDSGDAADPGGPAEVTEVEDSSDPAQFDLPADLAADTVADESGPKLDGGALGGTITADKTQGNAPLTVHFSADLTGCAEAEADYLWTFMQGTYSQKKAPGAFIFQQEGAYNVKVDVHCASNDQIASDQVQVLVRAGAQLALSKISLTSPSTIAPGDTVMLTYDVVNKGGQIDAPFKVLTILSKDEVYQPAKDVVLKETTIPKMDDGRYTTAATHFASDPSPLPTDTPEGSYFLFVVVDPDNVVTETDDTDNVGQATSFLTVKNAAKDKPDLTVAPPDFMQGTTVAAGKALSYSLTITNVGKLAAKNFKYAVFASTDQNLSPDDVKLTSDDGTTVFNLDPGKPLTVSASLLVPATTAAGSYWAIAQVDITDQVYEADETNNLAISPWPFTVVDDTVHGFDLNLETLTVTPHDTYFGGSLKVVAKVSNPGDKATPKYPVSFYISKEQSVNPNYDDDLLDLLADPIPAGGSVTLTQVVPIPNGPQYKGDFYLSVLIDVHSTLDELSKTNNWLYDPAPIHIFANAFVDVGLSGLVFHPAAVEAGKELKVGYTLANTGSTTSGAFVNYVVLSPDKTISLADIQAKKDYVIGKFTIDPVSPSELVERVEKVPVPIGLPHDVGQYYVGVIGDALNNLTVDTNKANQILVSDQPLTVLGPQGGCFEDSLEPNNDATTATPLPPGPTVQLGLCGGEDWFKVDVVQGQSLMVGIQVTSPLYLEARPFDLALDIVGPDGKTLDTANHGGAQDQAAAFAVATGGTYLLRVYPRSAGNQAQYRLDVNVSDPSDGVDLTPVHVSAGPTGIYPGGLLWVSATMANLGGTPAPASQALLILSTDLVPDAGDVTLATVAVPEVPAASSVPLATTVKLPTDVAGGAWYLLLVADSASDLVETDESNNVGPSNAFTVDETKICLDDAFEPNDTLEIATKLDAVTRAYPALVVCPDLPDMYRFELPAGVSFQVALTYDHKADSGWLALEVTDGAGEVMDAVTSSPAPVAGLPYVFTPGPYYVRARVNPASGKSGPYTYSMAVTISEPLPGDLCVADSREPNNGFSEASTVGCGVNHLTLCKKDRDFFKLVLAKGTALSVALQQSKGELKAGLYTDPKGSTVKVINGNGSFDYVAADDVTTYLVVEPKSSSTGVSDFGYALTVDGVPGMDLAVGALSLDPVEVYQGEDIQVSFQVSNRCMEPVPAFDLAVYLSSDAKLDAGDVPTTSAQVTAGLAAKTDLPQVLKAMVPLDLAPGKYFVLVQADPQNLVVESQEDNNVSSAAVTVASICLNDPLEPDNAADQAALIGSGSYVDLVVCPYDIDWYRVVGVPQGSTVTVTMNAPIALGDLDLRLYAAPELAKPVAISATKGDVETVWWVVPADGDYYIRVNGFLGDSAKYDLRVDVSL